MRRALPCVRSPGLHLRAGVVLPVGGAPIPDGAVRVCQGQIAAVAPGSVLAPHPGDQVLSLPDGILLPGLVNAHCHLELGGLAGRVPFPGTFPGWLLSLMALGRPDEGQAARSVRAGARALLAGGATCVGDITTTGFVREPLRHTGLRGVSYRELIGMTPERVEAALGAAAEWVRMGEWGSGGVGEGETGRRGDGESGRVGEWGSGRAGEFGSGGRRLVRAGVAPHAPYSTADEVYQEAARMALAGSVPFSTHLSESPEEIEFVGGGAGGLRDLLLARGIPMEAWRAAGGSPIRYLHELGVLDVPGAAAHVNYLLPGDLELLAAGRLVPVYCPGSHAFFGHPPHPAGEMLRAGIPVALGTDSLASNEGLDMLAEARAAWHRVPGTSAEDWVRAGTLHGARALCLDALCGTLEPGKRADLIVAHPGQHAADPYAAVLSPGTTVQMAMVDGAIRWLGG